MQPPHAAPSRTSPLTRRSVLRGAAVAGAAAALPAVLPRGVASSAAFAAPPAPTYRTKHVIVVAFAGGVRARECIGKPSNVPNLMRIAEKGAVLPNVKAANLGHYGAALAIFTGCPDAQGIRENARGENPTIFEYLRKDAGLPAHEVWLSTTAGAQTVNFAYGTHADYGAKYGANLISTDGLFNAEFRDLVGSFGQVSVPSDAEAARVEKLAKSLDPKWTAGGKGDGLSNDPAANLRIQRYILEELRGDTSDITGPGAGDAKSIRVARNLFRLFRPKLIACVLQNADVAHGSFNSYEEVIRRNDRELGLLWDAVQSDAQLRDTTSIFVLPEFGRDASLNQRNGLDHGDGSEDLGKIFCVAAGPDFKQGKTLSAGVDAFDVCPTIAQLFGAKAPVSRGKAVKALFA
ncbi:MAG: hypothetical protein HMLKMBBP_01644 [Planctomycetes bacterium]|nr:hypothetical protein [Planctomycetota bacterium]